MSGETSATLKNIWMCVCCGKKVINVTVENFLDTGHGNVPSTLQETTKEEYEKQRNIAEKLNQKPNELVTIERRYDESALAELIQEMVLRIECEDSLNPSDKQECEATHESGGYFLHIKPSGEIIARWY